jgi:hypothetical protein
MHLFVKPDGSYYGGDQQPGDIVAPSDPTVPGSTWDFSTATWRPGPGYTWDAKNLVWVALPALPDVAGFLRAIPSDGKLPTADIEAIVTSGAGQLALQALGLGDFAHFQARYNDIKAAPPAPSTAADLTEFAALAAQYHIPLTP